MLATDEKCAKKTNNLKVAVKKNSKHAVYCITAQGTRNATPACVPERVDKLLREDDWLSIACKKYRLPNKELLNLRKTWSMGASEFVNAASEKDARDLHATIRQEPSTVV